MHGSLDGRTPWEVWYERARLTPLFEEVEALYEESAERIRHPNYQIDLQLASKQEFGRNHFWMGTLPPKPPRFIAFGQDSIGQRRDSPLR